MRCHDGTPFKSLRENDQFLQYIVWKGEVNRKMAPMVKYYQNQRGKNMRLILGLCILVFTSCLTKKHEIENEEENLLVRANAMISRLEQAPKVNAQNLTFDLKADTAQWGRARGVLLLPSLSEHGNYIDYTACTFNVIPKACTSGKIPGARPEVRWDFPSAHVMIRYRACVLTERALSNTCSSEKIVTYPSLNISPSKNDPEVQKNLNEYQELSHKIRALAFDVRSALKEYAQSSSKTSTDAYELKLYELAKNQLAMDPYIIGSFYDTSLMDDYLEASKTISAGANEGFYKKNRLALVLLNFGTNDFIRDVWPLYLGLANDSKDDVLVASGPIKPSAPALPNFKPNGPIPKISSTAFPFGVRPAIKGAILASNAAGANGYTVRGRALTGLITLTAVVLLQYAYEKLNLIEDPEHILIAKLNAAGEILVTLKAKQTELKNHLDRILGSPN